MSQLVDTLSLVLFKIMCFIIRLAPLGVLGAIAFTVGKYGVGSLKQLGMLVALFYGSVLFFVLVVLGLVMRLSRASASGKLLRYLREELAVVFATTSSDSVLPQIMAKLRKMGIRDSTVGLVIPTGYSFNLDAFSIYLTLAAVFIAQATNTPISMTDLLTILAISLVTSKGAHGVPGSAIVVLAATLHAIPAIPAIGLVLVLSVDWFMGIARALGNLIGNCVATVAIAAWEGDVDREQARRVLDGHESPDDEPLAEPGSPVAVAGHSQPLTQQQHQQRQQPCPKSRPPTSPSAWSRPSWPRSWRPASASANRRWPATSASAAPWCARR